MATNDPVVTNTNVMPCIKHRKKGRGVAGKEEGRYFKAVRKLENRTKEEGRYFKTVRKLKNRQGTRHY